MVFVEKEMSDDILRRSCSDIRPALWTRRCCCCESELDTVEVRPEFVTGELADRRDFLLSVCRSNLCACFGESMITASTVDVEEIPDNRWESGSRRSSWDGQPISARKRSMEELAARLEGSLSPSRSVCSRIKEAFRFSTSSVSFSESSLGLCRF